MSYRVYAYGVVGEPTGDTEGAILDVIRLRNNLWNSLVEIERDIRSRALRLLTVPENQVQIDASKAQLEEMAKLIKAAKKQKNKELVAKLTEDRNRERTVFSGLIETAKANRAAHKETVKAELATLEAERKLRVKAAYNENGSYWGNYNDELAAYNTARVAAMKAGVDLRFRPWRNGEGKITVLFSSDPQPTGSVTGDPAYVPNTRIQIDSVSSAAFDHPRRSMRRRMAQTTGRIRIGSVTGTHSPRWIEFKMVYHRPLPPGLVRAASLVREVVGLRHRYKLIVTVETPDVQTVPAPELPVVAVDLGWRKLPQGLRVAYWADTEGKHGELVLGDEFTSQFRKVSDLRSILDQKWNVFHTGMCAWLKLLPASLPGGVPDWFTEATETFSAWKSQRRAYGLYRRWAANRFAGDDAGFALADEWRERYEHLYEWEANLHDQVLSRRKHLYRNFAAHLVRTYGKVILEEFNLTRVCADQVGAAARQRVEASVSGLRLAIAQDCARDGVEFVAINAANTTQLCHVCGATYQWDAAESVSHGCLRCGSVYDQDFNACINILRAAGHKVDITTREVAAA